MKVHRLPYIYVNWHHHWLWGYCARYPISCIIRYFGIIVLRTLTGQIIYPAMNAFWIGLFLIDGTRVVNLLTYQISRLKNIDRPNNISCHECTFWTRFVSYRQDQSGKFANISNFNFWSSCIMSYFATSPFKFSR